MLKFDDTLHHRLGTGTAQNKNGAVVRAKSFQAGAFSTHDSHVSRRQNSKALVDVEEAKRLENYGTVLPPGVAVVQVLLESEQSEDHDNAENQRDIPRPTPARSEANSRVRWSALRSLGDGEGTDSEDSATEEENSGKESTCDDSEEPHDEERPLNATSSGNGIMDKITNPSLRGKFQKAVRNFNVFLSLFTSELNVSLDNLLEAGAMKDNYGNAYKKVHVLHAEDEAETRFMNTDQVIPSVLRHLTQNLSVLGVRKMQAAHLRTIEVQPHYAVSDMIRGVMETVVHEIDPKAAEQLNCVMCGIRKEISKNVKQNNPNAVYRLLVPVYYHDPVGDRVRCVLHIIRWVLDKRAVRVMMKGKTRDAAASFQARIGIESYGVGLEALDDIIGGAEESLERGDKWADANSEMRKLGAVVDPKNPPKPIPAYAVDQL